MALRASRSDFVRVSSTSSRQPDLWSAETLALHQVAFKARPSHQTGATRRKTTAVRTTARETRPDGSSGTGAGACPPPRCRPSRAGSPPTPEPHLLGHPLHHVRHGVLPEGQRLLPQPRLPGPRVRRGRAVAHRQGLELHRRPVPAAAALHPAQPTTYEPFALAAVELAEEQIVILGQVAEGLRRRRPHGRRRRSSWSSSRSTSSTAWSTSSTAGSRWRA